MPINRRKPLFDMTINLGHLITLIVFVVTGTSVWNSMNSRQEKIELQQAYMEERMREQEARTKDTLQEIKSDVKTVQRTIDDIKLIGVTKK